MTTPPMTVDEIWLRNEMARLDRSREESDKFRAEQRKLMAEALKYEREHRLAPWVVVGGYVGYGVAAAVLVAKLLGH